MAEDLQYRGRQHLLETIGQLAQRDDACFTVIVHARAVNVLKGLARMAGKCPTTILLHNPSRFLNVQRMFTDGSARNAVNVQILIYGSFYKILDGLPRGYLVGSEAQVRELRYTSRGYMYTTSTPPFIMAMIQEALEAAGKHETEARLDSGLASRVSEDRYSSKMAGSGPLVSKFRNCGEYKYGT